MSGIKGSKIKFYERLKIFFSRFIHYIGIIFAIVVACYVLYVCVPEFLRFCMDFIIEMIKSDYPSLAKPKVITN